MEQKPMFNGLDLESLPFCDDDEEADDEVYFGPVSAKEQRKIDKFGRRKTAVFQPGFRNDPKYMRRTINRMRVSAYEQGIFDEAEEDSILEDPCEENNSTLYKQVSTPGLRKQENISTIFKTSPILESDRESDEEDNEFEISNHFVKGDISQELYDSLVEEEKRDAENSRSNLLNQSYAKSQDNSGDDIDTYSVRDTLKVNMGNETSTEKLVPKVEISTGLPVHISNGLPVQIPTLGQQQQHNDVSCNNNKANTVETPDKISIEITAQETVDAEDDVFSDAMEDAVDDDVDMSLHNVELQVSIADESINRLNELNLLDQVTLADGESHCADKTPKSADTILDIEKPACDNSDIENEIDALNESLPKLKITTPAKLHSESFGAFSSYHSKVLKEIETENVSNGCQDTRTDTGSSKTEPCVQSVTESLSKMSVDSVGISSSSSSVERRKLSCYSFSTNDIRTECSGESDLQGAGGEYVVCGAREIRPIVFKEENFTELSPQVVNALDKTTLIVDSPDAGPSDGSSSPSLARLVFRETTFSPSPQQRVSSPATTSSSHSSPRCSDDPLPHLPLTFDLPQIRHRDFLPHKTHNNSPAPGKSTTSLNRRGLRRSVSTPDVSVERLIETSELVRIKRGAAWRTVEPTFSPAMINDLTRPAGAGSAARLGRRQERGGDMNTARRWKSPVKRLQPPTQQHRQQQQGCVTPQSGRQPPAGSRGGVTGGSAGRLTTGGSASRLTGVGSASRLTNGQSSRVPTPGSSKHVGLRPPAGLTTTPRSQHRVTGTRVTPGSQQKVTAGSSSQGVFKVPTPVPKIGKVHNSASKAHKVMTPGSRVHKPATPSSVGSHKAVARVDSWRKAKPSPTSSMSTSPSVSRESTPGVQAVQAPPPRFSLEDEDDYGTHNMSLEEKKERLRQLKEEKRRLQRKLGLTSPTKSRLPLHRSPAGDGPSVRPRVRYSDVSAVSLSGPELDAVTKVHTMCNGHQTARIITKPGASLVNNIPTYEEHEASLVTFPEQSEALAVDVADLVPSPPPKLSSESPKPILHKHPESYMYPYHDQPPSPVILKKVTRSPSIAVAATRIV